MPGMCAWRTPISSRRKTRRAVRNVTSPGWLDAAKKVTVGRNLSSSARSCSGIAVTGRSAYCSRSRTSTSPPASDASSASRRPIPWVGRSVRMKTRSTGPMPMQVCAATRAPARIASNCFKLIWVGSIGMDASGWLRVVVCSDSTIQARLRPKLAGAAQSIIQVPRPAPPPRRRPGRGSRRRSPARDLAARAAASPAPARRWRRWDGRARSRRR